MDWKGIDWVWWLEKIWTIIFVPAFAIPAFVWQIKDRKEKKYGKLLSVNVRKLNGWPPFKGFLPLEISFLNENPFSVIVTEISLRNKKGRNLAMAQAFPFLGAEWVLDAPDTVLNVKFIVPSSNEIGSEPLKTGSPKLRSVCFIAINALEEGSNQIEISFVYHSTRFSDRQIKTVVTSEPIEITAEDIAKT